MTKDEFYTKLGDNRKRLYLNEYTYKRDAFVYGALAETARKPTPNSGFTHITAEHTSTGEARDLLVVTAGHFIQVQRHPFSYEFDYQALHDAIIAVAQEEGMAPFFV